VGEMRTSDGESLAGSTLPRDGQRRSARHGDRSLRLALQRARAATATSTRRRTSLLKRQVASWPNTCVRPPGTRASGRLVLDSAGRRVHAVHCEGTRHRAHDDALVHNDAYGISVHRHNAGKPRGRCGPDARATRWARRRRRPSQVLFRLSLFEIAKLQKVPTNLKISKNRSCRGAIDLQLSQRATYVLINRFVGKSC
jgi:hypothetical protein